MQKFFSFWSRFFCSSCGVWCVIIVGLCFFVWKLSLKILRGFIIPLFLVDTVPLPRNDFSPSKHSHVPNLQRIFLSVAASDHSDAIIPERNWVTTNTRSKNRMDRPSVPYIIDLNSIVPSATNQHILLGRIELGAENSIWMSRHFAPFLHSEG